MKGIQQEEKALNESNNTEENDTINIARGTEAIAIIGSIMVTEEILSHTHKIARAMDCVDGCSNVCADGCSGSCTGNCAACTAECKAGGNGGCSGCASRCNAKCCI